MLTCINRDEEQSLQTEELHTNNIVNNKLCPTVLSSVSHVTKCINSATYDLINANITFFFELPSDTETDDGAKHLIDHGALGCVFTFIFLLNAIDGFTKRNGGNSREPGLAYSR